jgi:phosphatidylglycerol---prolipoprotein diacylglyceryl transferase
MHKIAFQFGPLAIHWYGVMVALGFLAGLWTASRRAPQDGIHPERILDLGPWLIVGAIVGSRLLFVISYWDEYFARQPWYEVFMIQRGGLVFYGGLIGSFAAGVIFIRWKKLPFLKVADVMAPSIALGHAFGRIGCLMNGCCYGKPTESFLAIHFPADHETEGVGVHPTEIYESVLNALLYLGLAWMFRRKKFDGQIFALYLLLYAVLRGTVECFRGDYSSLILGWITPGQVASAVTFALGVVMWRLASRKAEAPTPIKP